MCETPNYFSEFVPVKNEELLYDPLCDFLRTQFEIRLKPWHGRIKLVVQKTDKKRAPSRGHWQRPDVTAVSISRHRYAANVGVAVHTFEVKTSDGGEDVKSVFQALAYSRFANTAYLVWNRQHCICNDQIYPVVLESCERFGVGLITIHDLNDIRTFNVRAVADHREISLNAIDDFIETRLNDSEKYTITRYINELSGNIT